jgi:hypothetical protein
LFILFSDTHWIGIHGVSDTYPIHIHHVSASLVTYRCFVYPGVSVRSYLAS